MNVETIAGTIMRVACRSQLDGGWGEAMGTFLPALVISMAFSGGAGVRQMLATLVRPRGSIVYYLVALLTFPFIHVVGAGITNVMNGRAWFSQTGQVTGLVPALLITFVSVPFYSGGINVESGWRGFAQRRLQARYSPLVANLMM